MTAPSLTEFLLARIAEDEVAQLEDIAEKYGASGGWHRADCALFTYAVDPCTCATPTRVLAECEAKRRIVTLMGYVRESWENKHAGEGRVLWDDINRREKSHALTILENLAAVYADHPDYDEAWRA